MIPNENGKNIAATPNETENIPIDSWSKEALTVLRSLMKNMEKRKGIDLKMQHHRG